MSIMLAACEEVKRYSEDRKAISVSLDGSWQIKGMSSHHGLVTAISTDIWIVTCRLIIVLCVKCGIVKTKTVRSTWIFMLITFRTAL